VIALPKPNKKEAALAPAFSSLKKRSKTCPPDLQIKIPQKHRMKYIKNTE
jgi:hypothetical protein